MARRAVEEVVDAVFNEIVLEVHGGRRVSVVGFGTFNPISRAPRVGRNPRTGDAVQIPASKGVRFAAGSTFKQALNSKEGAPMAVKKAAAKKSVKKAPARKTAARKVVKRAPARRTAAKKAVRKKVAARKATAKKAVRKKAPARKA